MRGVQAGIVVVFLALPASMAQLAPLPPAIQTGQVSNAQSVINRHAIESQFAPGATVNLPDGTIWLDKALTPVSGCTIQGSKQSVLYNAFTGSPYGQNCSAFASGSGCGYVDPFTIIGPHAIRVSANVAANCQSGSVLFFFDYDGYTKPRGMCTTRRSVVRCDGTLILLDDAVPANVDSLKWVTRAAYLADAAEGDTLLTLQQEFAAMTGDLIVVTSGPTNGNALDGEWHTVKSAGGKEITLAEPLRRSYKEPVIAAIQPVKTVTLRNLTLALPINGNSQSIFFSKCYGWTLDNCTIVGGCAISESAKITMNNCTMQDVGLNSTHDLTVSGGRCRSVAMEEGCFDIRLCNLTIAKSEQNGVFTNPYSPSERILLSRVTVEDCAISPFSIGGRECVLDRCRSVRSKNLSVGNGLSGDRLIVTDFQSDLNTAIVSGAGIYLSQLRSPWFLGYGGEQPVGVAVDCAKPTVKVTPATLAQWRLLP